MGQLIRFCVDHFGLKYFSFSVKNFTTNEPPDSSEATISAHARLIRNVRLKHVFMSQKHF